MKSQMRNVCRSDALMNVAML
eukprot:COSAG04_NODE_22682_length_351_cov_0.507937_1_plen_20_part_01